MNFAVCFTTLLFCTAFLLLTLYFTVLSRTHLHTVGDAVPCVASCYSVTVWFVPVGTFARGTWRWFRADLPLQGGTLAQHSHLLVRDATAHHHLLPDLPVGRGPFTTLWRTQITLPPLIYRGSVGFSGCLMPFPRSRQFKTAGTAQPLLYWDIYTIHYVIFATIPNPSCTFFHLTWDYQWFTHTHLFQPPLALVSLPTPLPPAGPASWEGPMPWLVVGGSAVLAGQLQVGQDRLVYYISYCCHAPYTPITTP